MGKLFLDRKAKMAEKNNDGTVVEASVEVLPDSLQVHQTLELEYKAANLKRYNLCRQRPFP